MIFYRKGNTGSCFLACNMKRPLLLVWVTVWLGLFAIPQASHGQPIVLGTASSYALFTADGPFNNTGPTVITGGDIGTAKGAVTGFPPGTISGGVIQQETMSASGANVSVRAAYAELTGRACGVTLLTTTLGNGQVLTPNVYCLTGNQTLSGTLTLNGGGDPDAVFILKINGNLVTAAASQVVLTNGAVFRNVFWQVSRTVELGTNSIFKGIAVTDGSITLLNAARIEGRGLTQGGAISLNTIMASPLPVELTRFTADRQGENVLLRWATASEKNSAYFALESSGEGRVFTRFARVGGQGTTSQPHSYAFADSRPARYASPVVYYRLRQVDTDSVCSYSPVRAVAVPVAAGLHVSAYPTPAHSSVSVRIEVASAGRATLCLTDALGHLFAHRYLDLVAGTTVLTLSESQALAAGLYLVHVQQGDLQQVAKFVRD